jgi:hypothetical protein
LSLDPPTKRSILKRLPGNSRRKETDNSLAEENPSASKTEKKTESESVRQSAPKSISVPKDGPTRFDSPHRQQIKFPVMEESLKGKRPEQLFPKQQRKLGKGSLGITSGLEAYDILKNLDNIKPDITLKQLLAISPVSCDFKLGLSSKTDTYKRNL